MQQRFIRLTSMIGLAALISLCRQPGEAYILLLCKTRTMSRRIHRPLFSTLAAAVYLIQSACNLKRANLAKARDAKSSVYRVHAPGRQDCQTTYLTPHAREGVNTVDMLLTTLTAVKPCRFVWIVFSVSAQSLSWSLPDLAKQLQRESHSKRFPSPIDHPRLAD